MATPETTSRLHRLAAYRPVLDRLIFGVALVGVLVVAHLGIQQERAFAGGCFGFGAEAAAASNFDCGAVLSSAASTFLGVSNVVWGFVFYGATAALTLGAAFVASAGRRRLIKTARLALVGFGVLYTARLLYIQFFQLDALCALCLTSAALVGALLVLQLAELLSAAPSASARRPVAWSRRKREAALLGALAALALVIAGADAFYFGGQDAPPPEVAAAERAEAPRRSAATPAAAPAASDTLQVAEGCYYDPEKNAVANPSRLVSMGDAILGNASAPVTVIEYFDPNCPHCATFHPTMQRLQERYGDRARFVYKPVPLWEFSVPQIEALYAAGQEGRFDAMLEAQFARQQRGGLSAEQLQGIAREIGMDPGVLMARLRGGLYRAKVAQSRQQAVEIGLQSTPTVLINGRFVAQRSRTARCLAAMIEAAAEEAVAANE